MAKIEEIAIDTNIALDMIRYYDQYSNAEDKENYFSRELIKDRFEMEKNSIKLMEFIETRLEEYQDKVKEYKRQNLFTEKSEDGVAYAKREYQKLKEYYNSTQDEEQMFLTMQQMVTLYKSTKKDLKNELKESDENIKEKINKLHGKLDKIKDNIVKNRNKSVYQKQSLDIIVKQTKLTQRLENILDLNKMFGEDENKLKKIYDTYCHKIQDISAIEMCEKMVTGKVQIVIPEFVYEELCNHTKEFHPYDKIKQQKITSAIVSEKQLDAFTANCTLSIIQDKHLRNYIYNIAYLLRSDIKDTISKKELDTNKDKYQSFKGKDAGSCGKFADSKIAVYAYISGICVVTNNHDDFLGKEIVISYNEGSPENSKIEKLNRKDNRRNLFLKMAKSGLKCGDKIILIDGPKDKNMMVGQAITFYEFNGKKFKKVNKSKVFKHQELTVDKLEKIKNKFKKEFRKNNWIKKFNKITEVTIALNSYNELVAMNDMVTRTREEKEEEILNKLTNKDDKNKDCKGKGKDKISPDKEFEQIVESINRKKEEFEALTNVTSQNGGEVTSNIETNVKSSCKLIDDQTKE